jgi:hypothetical protein
MSVLCTDFEIFKKFRSQVLEKKIYKKNVVYKMIEYFCELFSWEPDDKIPWKFQDQCTKSLWWRSEIFNKFGRQVLEKKICKNIQPLYHSKWFIVFL